MRLADAISMRSRRRKLALFLEVMRPDAATTVLDIGVDEVSLGDAGGQGGCTTHNFLEERYPWPERLTALGLHDGARFRERYPRIHYVRGDACALPFPDASFDVVHSNAVIEHVGGRDRQEAFVREALRVGRRVFVTTPNRWFPIEVHTQASARPLAPGAGRRQGVRPRRQVVGAGEPPPRPVGPPVAVPAAGRDPQPRHDARGDRVTTRFPRIALLVLVVGLALHNLAMALLWQAGVRNTALDAVAAWKDVLLLVAVVIALAAAGSIPRLVWADRLALGYGAIVVVYWLLPQSWLDGEATARGELYALRHHLLPLGAYLLGRLITLDRTWWRRVALTLVGVGVGLAVFGLVDVYLVPLQWWRDSGVPDWFHEQLGLAYRCLSYLPENWILNTDEESPARRLVSTFLSPLATAYALLVVLLLLVAARPRGWTVAAGAVVYAGLLWTHTRAAFIALPAGLLVLAVLRRSWTPALLAAGSVVVTVAFVALFPTIGPTTTYTAAELVCLRENAAVGRARPPTTPSRPARALPRAT